MNPELARSTLQIFTGSLSSSNSTAQLRWSSGPPVIRLLCSEPLVRWRSAPGRRVEIRSRWPGWQGSRKSNCRYRELKAIETTEAVNAQTRLYWSGGSWCTSRDGCDGRCADVYNSRGSSCWKRDGAE